ncbi:MAG: hypothetical protein IKP54_10265 [Bacteroidales bacterium]|nr:hypothetical protein [Bacteroidales bacterium]
MENNFKKYENLLWMDLTANSDFMVEGDATSFIEKWAENKGVEILSMELHSIEDVRGERVIVSDAANPYFYYKYWWLDMAEEHTEKKYLMLFYVEEADIRAINALKSFIELKPENLFYGIVCRDSNKAINSTINRLCGGRPIKWGAEE